MKNFLHDSVRVCLQLYGNVILMTAICIVIFWMFMALRPANAACWQAVVPGMTGMMPMVY